MTTRKYYVMVPPAFSYSGRTYWQELLDVKSLTSAQYYVNHVFGGLTDAEIWTPGVGGVMKVASKKKADGKWKVVYDRKTDAEDHPNCHYHLSNLRFSREDFYKYGFPHEKHNCCSTQ